MACSKPLKSWPNPKGGRPVFERPRGDLRPATEINCGQCLPCRMKHGSDWATRMGHEQSLTPHSEYVTFTYAPKHLPPHNSLRKSDFQKFMVALRNEYKGEKIRFMQCGEYGSPEETNRPHHHAILFGVKFPDREFHKSNNRGDPLYLSATLTRLWPHGEALTGEVNRKTCAYIAGYLLKDINDPEWQDADSWANNADGFNRMRQKPYASMSNHPGIGHDFCVKYLSDLFPDDFCLISGKRRQGAGKPLRDVQKKVPVPGYYLKILERLDPEMYEQVVNKRRSNMETLQHHYNHTPRRRETREAVLKARINLGSR